MKRGLDEDEVADEWRRNGSAAGVDAGGAAMGGQACGQRVHAMDEVEDGGVGSSGGADYMAGAPDE